MGNVATKTGNVAAKTATAGKSIKAAVGGPAPSDLWPLSNLLLIFFFRSFLLSPVWAVRCFLSRSFYCYNKTIKLIFIGHRDGYLHSDTQLPV